MDGDDDGKWNGKERREMPASSPQGPVAHRENEHPGPQAEGIVYKIV